MSKVGILAAPVGLLLVSVAMADTPKPAPAPEYTGTNVMLVPNDLKWGDPPPGLPKGAKFAVLEGDPSKPGPYTVRGEFPPGYQIKPHTHPVIEHITVISGELYMGSGEKFDEAKAKPLPAGGFSVIPLKQVHWVFTKDKKTVIQLHGVGPWGITYVNPADDPRGAPGK
jgi:quercetin dioxygenase-like cupin family protein